MASAAFLSQRAQECVETCKLEYYPDANATIGHPAAISRANSGQTLGKQPRNRRLKWRSAANAGTSKHK